MHRLFTWGGLPLLILLALLPIAVWASDGITYESVQFQTTTGQPATIQSGTVNANRLNVRAAPRLFSRAIGQLTRGTVVQIVGREGNWFQIVYAPAADGKGWVSASYIVLDTATTPPAAATSFATAVSATGTPSVTAPISSTLVTAPANFVYNGQRFAWSWQPAAALTGRDWYFDVQLFCKNFTTPFQVFTVEPSAAGGQGGNWIFTLSQPVRPECDAYAVVQIAMRVNGKFSGWSSLKSNAVNIPVVGGSSSSSDGQSTPKPEPTSDAEPTSEPQPEPTSEPQPEPTSEPEPEPTGEAVR